MLVVGDAVRVPATVRWTALGLAAGLALLAGCAADRDPAALPTAPATAPRAATTAPASSTPAERDAIRRVLSSCPGERAPAGGGDYRRGDPEFGLYDDRDGDGIVCER